MEQDMITLGLTQPEKRSGPLENPAIPLASAGDWMWLGGGAETDAAKLVNTATAL
jgi:hypothetical protein